MNNIGEWIIIIRASKKWQLVSDVMLLTLNNKKVKTRTQLRQKTDKFEKPQPRKLNINFIYNCNLYYITFNCNLYDY